ncbi:hypothetical protein RRG08_014775 [Elysia crispata]|uniref:Uncharacterized protein n=1 Tax=Elysia crispata TaxID=231223 RepID=A0AAE1AVU0_9GAST|nr:hypothetical protein RRG08_014775 [Elysia crispata]
MDGMTGNLRVRRKLAYLIVLKTIGRWKLKGRSSSRKDGHSEYVTWLLMVDYPQGKKGDREEEREQGFGEEGVKREKEQERKPTRKADRLRGIEREGGGRISESDRRVQLRAHGIVRRLASLRTFPRTDLEKGQEELPSQENKTKPKGAGKRKVPRLDTEHGGAPELGQDDQPGIWFNSTGVHSTAGGSGFANCRK